MREKRTFGERAKTRNSDMPRVKYFLVMEGTRTEPIYFNTLTQKQNKTTLGISSLIDIVEVERTIGEKNWSNPKQLLDRVLLKLEESSTGQKTYGTLLDAIKDCFKNDEYLQKRKNLINDFILLLQDYIKTNLGKKLDDVIQNIEVEVNKIRTYFEKERPRMVALIASNLDESLEEQEITYDPEIDVICLIVDRDKNDFTEEQYMYVQDTCLKNNIQLYVSNPFFEFWLLLHFNGVLSFKGRSIENDSEIKKAIEKELKKVLHGYKKERYDAQTLIGRIDSAIENEKEFCEKIPELKNVLGSNVGKLIEELRKPR